MAKSKKPTIEYSETYVEGTYVPSKKDLISLIKKNQVNVSIIQRSKYSDGSEKMKISIIHQ